MTAVLHPPSVAQFSPQASDSSGSGRDRPDRQIGCSGSPPRPPSPLPTPHGETSRTPKSLRGRPTSPFFPVLLISACFAIAVSFLPGRPSQRTPLGPEWFSAIAHFRKGAARKRARSVTCRRSVPPDVGEGLRGQSLALVMRVAFGPSPTRFPRT